MRKYVFFIAMLWWSNLIGQGFRYQAEVYPDDSIHVDPNISFAHIDSHSSVANWVSNRIGDGNILSSAFTTRLKTDVYSGPDEFKERPFILVLHGEVLHFKGRQDKEVAFLCREYAKRGYVVASMSYRIARPSANFFQESLYLSAQDIRAAMHFFRTNAKKYGINPQRFILAGIGDGALAVLHSTYYRYNESSRPMEDKFGCLDCIADSRQPYYSPFAVVSIGGAMEDTSNFKNKPLTAVCLIHGEWDKVVKRRFAKPYETQVMEIEKFITRYNQSQLSQFINSAFGAHFELDFRVPTMYGSMLIHQRLNALGIKNDYVELPMMRHNLIFSQSGVRMRSADSIVSKSSTFIWSLLRDSVIIKGPDTLTSRNATFHTDPRYQCKWSVLGGEITQNKGHEINVRFDRRVVDCAVKLETWSEGVYNYPANKQMAWSEEQYIDLKVKIGLGILFALGVVFFAYRFLR